ncbi:MAG TPA: RIP metalloprotease RseP [Candidatus Dormibacteraeota bacterium]|nr:RIP metalloprotease RseP [Candidatus Dormibacteraeota bacterium]
MTLLLWAASFVGLILVVVGVHEFGHFAVAKLSGIRVDEFAIGFGPRLWQRRRGETVYALRALPLGGFVKMPGMSALEEDDGGERGFQAASTPRKAAVLVAGVAMNFLFAGILIGVTRTQGVDSAVSAGAPAASAGLQSGDVILSADGRSLDGLDRDAQGDLLHQVTLAAGGHAIPIVYRTAAGVTRTTTMVPDLVVVDANVDMPLRKADGGVYEGPVAVASVDGRPVTAGAAALTGPGTHTVTGAALGDPTVSISGTVQNAVLDQNSGGQIGRVVAGWRIGYAAPVPAMNPVTAILAGVKDVPGDIKDRVTDIWDILTTPGSGGVSNFSGPVGIAHAAADAADNGFLTWLSLVALVSLSLGIVNILPIPPFDGGRLAMVLAEAIGRQRLKARLEMGILAAGALALATLFVLVTINDIKGF